MSYSFNDPFVYDFNIFDTITFSVAYYGDLEDTPACVDITYDTSKN